MPNIIHSVLIKHALPAVDKQGAEHQDTVVWRAVRAADPADGGGSTDQ